MWQRFWFEFYFKQKDVYDLDVNSEIKESRFPQIYYIFDFCPKTFISYNM